MNKHSALNYFQSCGDAVQKKEKKSKIVDLIQIINTDKAFWALLEVSLKTSHLSDFSKQ